MSQEQKTLILQTSFFQANSLIANALMGDVRDIAIQPIDNQSLKIRFNGCARVIDLLKGYDRAASVISDEQFDLSAAFHIGSTQFHRFFPIVEIKPFCAGPSCELFDARAKMDELGIIVDNE